LLGKVVVPVTVMGSAEWHKREQDRYRRKKETRDGEKNRQRQSRVTMNAVNRLEVTVERIFSMVHSDVLAHPWQKSWK
jgi:hypothetical protein